MNSLENLDELQVAKLTWVWWYLRNVPEIKKEDLKFIFQTLQEQCGKEVTLTFICKFLKFSKRLKR